MQPQDYLLFSSCFIITTAFPLWGRISPVYYIYYILLITLCYSKGNVSIMVRFNNAEDLIFYMSEFPIAR